MCTFTNNPRTHRPETKKLCVGYKVAYMWSSSQPYNFCGDRLLYFGWLKWDRRIAQRYAQHDQDGFQIFANRKDAVGYACYGDYVYKVYFYAKDIVKATSHFNGKRKVFEVSKVLITKKFWSKRRCIE